jgi:CHAT domain-containing protein
MTILYSWFIPANIVMPNACRVRKILLCKAIAIPAFVLLTGILLAVDLRLGFTHVAGGQATRRSPEMSKGADELFQEALLLCGGGQRKLLRQKLSEAIRQWLQQREPEKAARAALQIAERSRHLMQLPDALYYYKEALAIEPLSSSSKAIALNSIAQVYAALYERDLALTYYERAIKQSQLAKTISAQTIALTGLAHISYEQGNRAQALDRILKARQLTRQQGDEETEASLLLLAAEIYRDQGLTERARGALEDSLLISKKAANVYGWIRTLCAMSNLSLLSNQKSTALTEAEEALALARNEADRAVLNADKLKAREVRWRAWLSLARAQRALGQKDAAVTSYLRAIHDIEGVWWILYISTERSAVASREESQAPYRELVDLLIEQNQFKKAYDWAERAKGRAILGLIEARRTTNNLKGAGKEGTLLELSHSIARLRTQLLSSNIGVEEEAELQRKIRDAESALEEAQVRTEMEQSRERMVWSQPTTAKQLQERVSQDKEALLEFLLGENHSFAWLFTPKDTYFEVLPGRKEIEKIVIEYLNALTVSPNSMFIERDLSRLKEKGEQLFSFLFGRLAQQIEPGQRLIIVPDGLLHYLPFEALIHDEHYLLEGHQISYLPSASMLSLWQNLSDRSEGGEKMELLAFGDPVFEPTSGAAGGKRSKNSPSSPERMRAALGFYLAPLPRTRDEVQYIGSLFPSGKRHIYLGKEATEEAVKREALHSYRRLHFATHSLIDEKSPSRSSVVLTLDDDPEEDGFLELSEISELDLDCDIVVLSSCQTARGQLLSGEGIIGLSRAFLHAGARSVVVSLWSVNDISTGQMMKSFYQQITSGASTAAALREAKLQMLQSGKVTRHPYYWAPFVIIGKP